MKSNKCRLGVADHSATVVGSEAALIDLLQKSERPIADVAFRTTKNVWSKTASINVEGLQLVGTAGSPMRFETAECPQYSIVLPFHGTGRITEGARSLVFGGKQIVRSSFCSRMKVDYEDYSDVSLNPDIEQLMDAINIDPRYRSVAREHLLETPTSVVSPGIGDVDYYAALRAVIRMIDHTHSEEGRIDPFGIGKLMMNLIARLTVQQDPELHRYMAR